MIAKLAPYKSKLSVAPKISVVTICYNCASEIDETITSVSEQTYAHVEYIVIDGASTDGTLERLRARSAEIDVLVSEPDGGIYDAMNKGLSRATGKFVIFINAGDHLYSKYVIELAADYMMKHPTLDVAYGGIEVRSAGGASSHFTPPAPSEAEVFLITHSLPHQATFANRRVFGRTKAFDSRYRTHGDYDWFLKVVFDRTLRVDRLPFTVASFASGGASSNLSAGERERHAIQNGFPALQSQAWLRRRIDLYQELYLSQRLQLEQARAPA
jgi:glycosyltransferase involved in cell wall biosynthesis